MLGPFGSRAWEKTRRTYLVWHGMKRRCYDQRRKEYKDYGARGITVCERWLGSERGEGFANFLRDMGEVPNGLRLERKDNNKGYSPDNCKWAGPKEQSRNTRRNVYVTYHGTRRSVPEWAEITGIPYDALRQRIAAGWPPHRALTQPVDRGIR